MRRFWIRSLFLVAALSAPTLLYETCEKAYEALGERSLLSRLSARAERSTPWRARTGAVWLDRTLHELEEAEAFYTLAAARLGRQLRSLG